MFVTGMPALILRLEGLVVLAAAGLSYAHLQGDWRMFALLFLLPDLSMLGYLVGRRIGAACYNAGHSYLGPALVAAVAWQQSSALAGQVALIWVAHIGFDRMLGYGLKYAQGFGVTHLGLKGKAARTQVPAEAPAIPA